MPKVDDHFAGHMFTGDPRSLLWAARGCIWPTIPAFHFLAKSENGTGAFGIFNTDIVLMEMISVPPAHETGVWFWEFPPEPDIWISATKTQDPADGLGYRWSINIHFVGSILVSHKTLLRPLEKCNGPVAVGEMEAQPPAIGNTGDTFKLLPVVWDQTLPPA